MSKTLFALLFPFFNLKFNFGDDDGGAAASDNPSQPGASTAAETAKPDVPASTETASTETDDKQPEKALTQAEVDAIVQKRLAKERRKIEREVRLEVENEVLKKATNTPKDEPAAKPEGKPKQEDFATYEDYLEALAKHTVAEERRKAEAEAEEAKEKQTREAKAKTYAERAEKARERMPDFDDVVDQDLPVSRAMIEVIMESDIGPDLAYYLGKNPDEATRIAQLSPIAAARELGKIEAKLTPADKTDPPKPSDAPKPPNPVKGTTTVSSSPADNDSTDSWMKKRNKQVRTG